MYFRENSFAVEVKDTNFPSNVVKSISIGRNIQTDKQVIDMTLYAAYSKGELVTENWIREIFEKFKNNETILLFLDQSRQDGETLSLKTFELSKMIGCTTELDYESIKAQTFKLKFVAKEVK